MEIDVRNNISKRTRSFLERNMINRPIAVCMIYLTLFVTGLYTFVKLPLEYLPGLEYPQVSIETLWSNASPETIEKVITTPIEAVCNTLQGVKNIESRSEEGSSTITVDFQSDIDIDFVTLELHEKLSIVREHLPYDATVPRILKYVPKDLQKSNFLTYHLTGDQIPLSVLKRYADEKLQSQILSIDGIADVIILGGTEVILHIELIPEKLQLFNISHHQVIQQIESAGLQRGIGIIRKNNVKISARINHSVHDIQDIKNIIIDSKTGRTIHLQDIGSVQLRQSIPSQIKRINGNSAVVIVIYKESGSNSIKTAKRVFAKIAEIEKSFPNSMHIHKVTDESEILVEEVNELTQRAGYVLVIVFFVLFIAFKNSFSPVIVLCTIVLAILTSAHFFYLSHTTLNILTLSGLTLGFGMVVDNSIVVFESINAKHSQGIIISEAATSGLAEVALPVIVSTLTTIVAILPFLYMSEDIRLLYTPFTLASAVSLLSSLIVAFTFTPTLTVQFLKKNSFKNTLPQMKAYPIVYEKLLGFCLKHKMPLMLFVVLLFTCTFAVFIRTTKFGHFFNQSVDKTLTVIVAMSDGTDITHTDQIIAKFENMILENNFVLQMTSDFTKQFGVIHLTFPDSVVTSAVPLLLKEKLILQAVHTGGANVDVIGFGPSFIRGKSVNAASFQIDVLGYNYDKVKKIVQQIGSKLKDDPKVINLNTNTVGILKEEEFTHIVYKLDRSQLNAARLAPFHVLDQLGYHLRENSNWRTLSMHGQDYTTQIKMSGGFEQDINSIQRVNILNSDGVPFQMSTLGDFFLEASIPLIERKNQQYKRAVTFDYNGTRLKGEELADNVIASMANHPGYTIKKPDILNLMSTGETAQIYKVVALSLLFVFMVIAAFFESFKQPFVVLMTVPMGLIGVFLVYLITGKAFDRGAYIGLVFSGGIVVNNAILLISQIRVLSRSGVQIYEAVIKAAQQRLRPILITSLTTVLGLIPLLVNYRDDVIWSSLALTTVGAVTSSALLVLFVVPVMVTIIEKK